MTLWSAVALLFLTLALGIAAWFLFMWGVATGQFDDMEGPKYRIFDDDDPLPGGKPDDGGTPPRPMQE